MKVVICLPTYNEKENIENIINAIFQQQSQLEYQLHVLVIDDSSPDGTAEIVSAMITGNPSLHMITGKKEGLGKAYLRGFKYAISTLNADIIMEMDADFSHDPKDILRMLNALEGFDFIIGSRYVPGGTIPANWGFFRKMNSRVGNIFARFIAGIPVIKDCTAGFRAIRSSLIRKIDLDNLHVKGYAFQIALLDRAVHLGARVKEIPVDFADRKYGETKMSMGDILEFIINCWWIRFDKLKTFIKFTAVGASGVVINLGFFTLFFNVLGLNKFIASPLAIEVSILSNFLLNYLWTFRDRGKDTHVGIKGLKFNAVSFIALGISYGTFVLLTRIYPAMVPQIAQFVGIIPATLVNYFLNSYWTFKKSTK